MDTKSREANKRAAQERIERLPTAERQRAERESKMLANKQARIY